MTEKKEKKNHAGMFKPGQSGNPSGRPKESYRISDLAKEHTEKALECLVEIMTNPRASSSARVHAACAVLDRAWGKPPQFVQNENVNLTYQDLINEIREREERYQNVLVDFTSESSPQNLVIDVSVEQEKSLVPKIEQENEHDWSELI
ncbi:MAG: DUF5681 domain-containing protein [Candidatus Melainabacteria bacterium]|nr:DUF5681 domain-containing protein [Candidatus Melainabacteria bacterium]